MRQILVGLAVLSLFLVCPAPAQQIGIFEEVTAGNFYGIGAKQMAMGGTGIANGWDGGALYYNPAMLTRIYRVEFQIGMSHQKFTSQTSQATDRYVGLNSVVNGFEDDLTKTRFSTVNLTVPVPTYRGSLVVGFGVNRFITFDRAYQLDVLDRTTGGLNVETTENELESGGIYLYSAGAGIDISPNISLGLSLNIYSGKRHLNYNYNYLDQTNNYSDGVSGHTTEDYIGAGVKGGLLARPNRNLSIGLVIESPVDWQIEQTFSEDSYYNDDGSITTHQDAGTVEYNLTRPFVFGGGVAFRSRTLTVTGDIEYIDWSQLSYNDNPAMEQKNDSLSSLYRGVLNLRLGAEYQLPRLGLALRGGIFSLPLANDKAIDNNQLTEVVDDDRIGFSMGFGWLMDRVLLLEGAFVSGSYRNHYTGYNFIRTERESTFQRIFMTVSYRY